MFQVSGRVAHVNITATGLSSCHIQPGDNPAEVIIVSAPRDLIVQLAGLTEVTVTVVEKK